MARSGVSAAQCLYELGARVTISDSKAEEKLAEALQPLEGMDIRRCLGDQAQPADLESYDLAVTSPGIPMQAPILRAVQAAGVPLIGELELGAQVSRAPLYAVTGTNGKTTTTTLIGEIFRNLGKTTYVVGNIGYPFTACALQCGEEDVAVAEVSSFQLETITTFHPHIAVMCNITEDHLNRHGTMEEYIRVKERIFENMGQGDYAVLNLDDPIVRGMAERIPCAPAFFSRRQEVETGAYLEGEEVVFSLNGHKKRVLRADEIRIPGEHNLENALAATALAMLAGVPAPVVRHTLKTFPGVEHRIETVRTVEGVTYINDSKGTNVDASIRAVRAMKAPTVLLAGGYDKHTDFLPLAREILASKIHTVVVLGDTAEQIERALRAVGFESILHAKTFEEAVLLARSCAREGENVLLSPACASFDMFQDYEERGRVFKEIVSRL
ncbi:MAG TPA: UDP-N-acetylmuramoyl-L-alanine--D-glutamate ligase [Candidatus Spyradocola merdavium]|nr:UDP-N-acetylmuramoyl-L-alanine--D-glutamate ligase [Candidatus Spyradocola merdavium]